MTSTLLQQAVEALTRARTFVLNGVSLAEPADETLPVIEAAIASLESALQQQPEPVATTDTHTPEIDRDSDGELLIDWAPGEGRMLSMTLRNDGRLSYAFTWDGEKAHGTAQMPPALQQQEEPREVLTGFYISGPYPDGNYSICELSSGRVLQLLGSDDFPQPLRDAALALAASPSPQDFTIPMLEDVHGLVCGGDGVKGSDHG